MREALFANWRHVFKLDPERMIDDEALEAVCLSGTDAVIVGGSSGVTFDNTVDLLSRIRRYEVSCALEVSTEEGVPGFDHYFIPIVLNSGRTEWITGKQAAAIARYGSFIPWEDTFAEGYLILNPEAEAARLTEAHTSLSAEEAIGYVRLADRLMRLPIVYIEYSGFFGDMELVGQARSLLTGGRLFYGGGIDSAEKARLAAAAADTVVVGNVVYTDLDSALETVRAVKEVF
ncbi:heptaprenylglyceryl phosphate synthase [Paenibacillus tarimensis]